MSSFVGRLLSAFCRGHALRVGKHPLKFIGAALAFAAVVIGGLSRVFVDSNPESIWVPPTSTTMLQQDFFNNAYDPFYRCVYPCGSARVSGDTHGKCVTVTGSTKSSSPLTTRATSLARTRFRAAPRRQHLVAPPGRAACTGAPAATDRHPWVS